ncbi:MAG: MBL fold metallo-hydrolase [Clostridia bacterium]|nr:MBL fold metallo-hydrolase [Clostridia bacterium]
MEDGGSRILIDAGGSMRQIDLALRQVGVSLCDIDGIWITHEHSDHTKGLPVMAKHLNVPFYCQRKVAKELYLSLMQKGNRVEAAALARNIRTVDPGEEYQVGDLLITPFQTPHDSVDSQGFIIGDRELGIATDLGHVSSEVALYLTGCKNVVLESNHDVEMLFDGPYPPYLMERVASDNGHLNNAHCAAFAGTLLSAGCENFTLFHLSSENNTPDLALQATAEVLCGKMGAVQDRDFRLRTALRHEVTKIL